MERLFQGASSASSSPATNNLADDDTWNSYDKYKSRDSNMKQNGAGAVKRFSTSNSDLPSPAPGLCIFVILSYLCAITLLTAVFDRYFDVHLTWYEVVVMTLGLHIHHHNDINCCLQRVYFVQKQKQNSLALRKSKVRLSVYLFVCLSVCVSVCMYVWLQEESHGYKFG